MQSGCNLAGFYPMHNAIKPAFKVPTSNSLCRFIVSDGYSPPHADIKVVV
jgi:hypothetical protein